MGPSVSRLRVAAVIAFVLSVAAGAAPARAQDRFRVDLEAGPAWQTRNDFAVPGDTGTRVELDTEGPIVTFRGTLFWNISPRWAVRAVAAPLRTTQRVVSTQDVSFAGATFPAGGPFDVKYVFNSWRLGVLYRFPIGSSWGARVGVTGKIRDAEIALETVDQLAPVSASKTDVGFVPLLYGGLRWEPRQGGWSLDLDVDGAGASQGYAIDAAVRAEYPINERARGYFGYRYLDGGGDVEEVYAFATFHYLLFGLSARF
jgi:hypothetical protein